MRDYDAKEHARTVAANVTEEDYAFTVKAVGSDWDVYHFKTDNGKDGTLAFKVDDATKQVTISVFQAGHLTKVQATAAVVNSYTPGGERRGNYVKGYVRNGVRVRGYYRGRR
jgi:hypothetical protein